MKCAICGREIEKSCYSDVVLCSNKCFDDYFWNECLDDKAIIINGRCYHIAEEQAGVLGYNGQRFKIKRHNGEITETNNLWYNGEIPKDRGVKDNAEFVR